MNDSALKPGTQQTGTQQPGTQQPTNQDIVVDEVLPHAPETIWRLLTSSDLIARWMMKPTGFEAVVGNRFTFQTKAAGQWDGSIQCEVLEVVPSQRLVYAWKGGHESNVGYGSLLNTVVTFTLTKVPIGTRLRLVHAGFVLPKNGTAYQSMGEGWKKVVKNVGTVADETH